jgi:dTDP-4-amino-4,6-dideoxygalactose transaminase
LPVIPRECESHCRTFYLILNSGAIRDDLMAFLKRHGVSAVFHFVPLHSSPMGKSFGYKEGDLRITERACECLLRLPSFYDITEAEQSRVADLVTAFLRRTPVYLETIYSTPRTGAARERAHSR